MEAPEKQFPVERFVHQFFNVKKMARLTVYCSCELPLIISSNQTRSIHRQDTITKTETAILKTTSHYQLQFSSHNYNKNS